MHIGETKFTTASEYNKTCLFGLHSLDGQSAMLARLPTLLLASFTQAINEVMMSYIFGVSQNFAQHSGQVGQSAAVSMKL